jgi:hypothetical protein
MTYLKTINQLIDIEKEFTERNIFSEDYLKQLKRRREIYLKGYAEGFRNAVIELKEKKLVVMDSEEMISQIENQLKESRRKGSEN